MRKRNLSCFEQEYCNLIQDESKLVWNFTKDERSKNRHSSMLTLGDYCYISVGMVLNADEKRLRVNLLRRI